MSAGASRSTLPRSLTAIGGGLPPCSRMPPRGTPATSRRTVRSLGRWNWWTASRRATTTRSPVGRTGSCWRIHGRCAGRSKYVAARGSGPSLRTSPGAYGKAAFPAVVPAAVPFTCRRCYHPPAPWPLAVTLALGARVWQPLDGRSTRDRRPSDEGGARGARRRCRRPDEETRGSHRRDRARQHRRGAPPPGEGRSARLQQFPPSGAASRAGAATRGPATAWTCRRSASPTSSPARSWRHRSTGSPPGRWRGRHPGRPASNRAPVASVAGGTLQPRRRAG